uniref:NAD(+)/NADH kinase n=1 Tax=Eubacterium cellulosolvens TaxID=29322 RepID=UPI000484160E|nr:NAD(+)/NADH kinase [[Eubacterium] cellulosolvens]
MKKFYIITNRAKDPDFSVTGQIAEYLETHGAVCFCRKSEGAVDENHRENVRETMPADTECVIVLGGDGTLMRAAYDVHGMGIPLIGINLGTLGYLAEIERPSIYPALDCLLADRFQMEKRMMLHGAVYHENRLVHEDIALNDIVIGRSGALHVMSLYNYVNGNYLNYYRGDGVIIASPTGSTGYSLSAGGPLISPDAALFLMTPLCAHTLNTRSIILPAENRITVRIGAGRDDTVENAMAYFDGGRKTPMVTNDRIEITRSEYDTLIVKIRNDSFLETLKRKMSDI